MAQLTEPMNFKRSVIVVVVGLNCASAIFEISRSPATFTEIAALDCAALNSSFKNVLGTINCPWSTVEMILCTASALRPENGSAPAQDAVHALTTDFVKFCDVLN